MTGAVNIERSQLHAVDSSYVLMVELMESSGWDAEGRERLELVANHPMISALYVSRLHDYF